MIIDQRLKILFVSILFVFPLWVQAFQEIHLKEFEHVAIATDLEPDDVLALKLIFEEANRLYTATANYPIDLVIVGEGNSVIKRQRMEKMLQEFFKVPVGVHVEVVEGKATRNNLFPYDGEELFDKSELIPFVEDTGEKAVAALEAFLAHYEQPLIIQTRLAP